jgi:pyruvate kinase
VGCNTFAGGFIKLKRGDLVAVIYSSDPRKSGLIRTKSKQMITNWKVGEPVVMDDGLMRMMVV